MYWESLFFEIRCARVVRFYQEHKHQTVAEKSECKVTPPALIAATPVGAAIMVFLKVLFLIARKKVVLPVPALPVKKTCRLVLLTYFAAKLLMSEKFSIQKSSFN
jgi:hypothetical protein